MAFFLFLIPSLGLVLYMASYFTPPYSPSAGARQWKLFFLKKAPKAKSPYWRKDHILEQPKPLKSLEKVSDPTLRKQLWWQECCQNQHSFCNCWIQWSQPGRCREGERHFCWGGAPGLAAGWKPHLGEVGAPSPANASSHLDLGVKLGARLKHGAFPPFLPPATCPGISRGCASLTCSHCSAQSSAWDQN